MSPANPVFANLATDAAIERASAALRENLIECTVVDSAAEARARVLELLPRDAELLTMSSMTLVALGLVEQLNESGEYRSLRKAFPELDPKLRRQTGAAPDWAVGSCHAVTEDGSLVWASRTGSQIAPYASGAGAYVLVVGAQKVVPDLESALRRLREYSLPLEQERVAPNPSSINKILVITREIQAGRGHVVLVREVLGF